jgi:DNA-binding CsgD family transcriptional regulator
MASERTMLFTDIEGSTALAHACGTKWPAVLADHGRLLVDAIDKHGGDIERTEGDSFFATFTESGDAVAAAVEAQRALAAQPWPEPVGRLKVRMGLHTGAIDPTDRYYVGIEIHRAARIMAAAHGGQILASGSTREAGARDVTFDDVGTHRLKDFAEPVALFHITYDGGPGPGSFPPPRSLGSGAALQLLDRDEELERLNGVVTRLQRDQQGGAVLIQGPAGIGKSSLMDAAVAKARETGLHVTRARGSELESGLAFGAVRELLAPVVMKIPQKDRDRIFEGPAQLARPVLGLSSGGQPEGDPLFGLFWMTVALAERSPLLLAIDDLHWLDEESARFVAYLVQRVEGLPVLLLASARPSEHGMSQSVELVVESSEVIRPRPLSAEAVGHLVRDRAAEDVLRVTGGNPLLAVELARAMAEAGPGAQLEEIGPRSVGKAVLRRVARVSEAAVALSRAVAISPEPLALADLAQLAGLSVEETRRAADALVRAEVLAHEGDRLTFLHPVMRTAVYEELDPFQRRQAHSNAAALLLEHGAHLERVAPHVLAGEPAGRDEYVSVLRAAAELAVERSAPRAACRYLERALEEPPPAGDLADIRFELGKLQHSLGRPEATDTLRAALGTAASPVLRCDIAVQLGDALIDENRPDEVLDLVKELRQQFPDDSSVGGDRLLDLDALMMIAAQEMAVEPSELRRLAERIPHDLRGDTPAEQRALVASAFALMSADEPLERAEEMLARVRARADLDAMRRSDAMLLVRLLSVLGQGEDADQLAAGLIDRARRTGEESLYVSAQFQFAISANQRGELRRCEAALRLGLEAPGMVPNWEIQYEDWLITTLSMQGRFDEAEALLERQLGKGHTLTHKMLSRRRMEIALDRGDYEAAVQIAGEVFDIAEGRVTTAGLASDYAIALAKVGRAEEALQVAQERAGRAEGGQSAQDRGTAAHALGVALAAVGRLDEALEHLASSVEVLASGSYRWNQANAEVDFGRVLIDAGRPEAARDVLMSPLEYAVAHGAAPIERQAREQLARAGVTVLEPSGVVARLLTPTEERIARLAARGLSEKEIAQRLFITTRTVEHHLGEALAKLRVDSRDELEAALAVTSVP